MEKLTVVIQRNASYEKGMYGLSIHDQPGGAGNVQPINSEAHLREKLLGFGFSEAGVKDTIGMLENKHDSVKLSVPRERRLEREVGSFSFTYTCDHCSWRISIERANHDEKEARRKFAEHACPDFPIAAKS
jgi:hypothetical protein